MGFLKRLADGKIAAWSVVPRVSVNPDNIIAEEKEKKKKKKHQERGGINNPDNIIARETNELQHFFGHGVRSQGGVVQRP